MTTAVVLGGGFAGVLVARVLARHADRVVLVEGGRYPVGAKARTGLPQGHHNHVLVAGGLAALDAQLPGTVDALLAHGAHRRELTGGALILSAQGWFHRYDTGAQLVSGSRWLLDDVVRRRALADGTVTVREDTRAIGLTGDAHRVTGAVVADADGRVRTIPADLVVDATGRRSAAHRWLADLGSAPVAEETVDPGMAYGTRLYAAPPDIAALPAIMVHPRLANGRPGLGLTLFPIEGDRWIVTLTGTRDAAPPIGESRFTECASALGAPLIGDLIAAARPLGGVRPYRATANRRRYYERGPRPAGFLVVGDAAVAVNPVYSHGLSIAAMSALRLSAELDRHGAEPAVFTGLQSAMAAVAEPSWRMAAAGDRGLVRGEADVRPAGDPSGPSAAWWRSTLAARARMSLALPTDRALMTAMFRAQVLLPPDAAVDASQVRDPAPPPLSTSDAVAQYPELSRWWRARRGHAVEAMG